MVNTKVLSELNLSINFHPLKEIFSNFKTQLSNWQEKYNLRDEIDLLSIHPEFQEIVIDSVFKIHVFTQGMSWVLDAYFSNTSLGTVISQLMLLPEINIQSGGLFITNPDKLKKELREPGLSYIFESLAALLLGHLSPYIMAIDIKLKLSTPDKIDCLTDFEDILRKFHKNLLHFLTKNFCIQEFILKKQQRKYA